RFLRVALAVVGEPEGAIAEPAAGLDVGRGLRDREGHAFESRQRSAEGLALLHVAHGLLQRDLGNAEARQGDADAVVVEALHHLIEARAFLPEAVRLRDADAVEGEHGAPDGPRAHVAERAA